MLYFPSEFSFCNHYQWHTRAHYTHGYCCLMVKQIFRIFEYLLFYGKIQKKSRTWQLNYSCLLNLHVVQIVGQIYVVFFWCIIIILLLSYALLLWLVCVIYGTARILRAYVLWIFLRKIYLRRLRLQTNLKMLIYFLFSFCFMQVETQATDIVFSPNFLHADELDDDFEWDKLLWSFLMRGRFKNSTQWRNTGL